MSVIIPNIGRDNTVIAFLASRLFNGFISGMDGGVFWNLSAFTAKDWFRSKSIKKPVKLMGNHIRSSGKCSAQSSYKKSKPTRV